MKTTRAQNAAVVLGFESRSEGAICFPNEYEAHVQPCALFGAERVYWPIFATRPFLTR